MFRQTRGYGNLNDLSAQLTPNFGYAGRLRDLTEQLQPSIRTMEHNPPPPKDVNDVVNAIGMKKGGRVKKYKVKQSNKNIAIAKNVVKVYYDRPRRRAARRKAAPVEEKKMIVQPSQVRPQFITNVMGGNPGEPIALNAFTKRLGALEEQLNKPKVLGTEDMSKGANLDEMIKRRVEEESKRLQGEFKLKKKEEPEIPMSEGEFAYTIPDDELEQLRKDLEKEWDKMELLKPKVEVPEPEEEKLMITEEGQKQIELLQQNIPAKLTLSPSLKVDIPFGYIDTGYDFKLSRADGIPYRVVYQHTQGGKNTLYLYNHLTGLIGNYKQNIKNDNAREQIKQLALEYSSDKPLEEQENFTYDYVVSNAVPYGMDVKQKVQRKGDDTLYFYTNKMIPIKVGNEMRFRMRPVYRNELNTKTYIFDGKMKDINSYDRVYRDLYKQYIKDAPIEV